MNLRDLEYFVSVAELKHFRKAAEACFVSQPTLSGQIKKLEESLGGNLFERSGKKVLLTQLGAQIYPLARNILHQSADLEELANSMKDPFKGVLRIGMIPTIAPYYLPRILKPLQETFPEIEFRFVERQTGQIVPRCENGELDLIILALPIESNKLESVTLFGEDFLLGVPEGSALSNKQILQFNDINPNELLLLEEGHCLRDHALDFCHLRNVESREGFLANNLETLRQLVSGGFGISLFPQMAVQNIQYPGIQYIPFETNAPGRFIGVMYRSSHPRQVCFEAICEKLKELD